MEFKLSAAGCSMESYDITKMGKDIFIPEALKDFNIRPVLIKESDMISTGEIINSDYYKLLINIETLEELMRLQNIINEKLIISENTIMIYDGYIE